MRTMNVALKALLGLAGVGVATFVVVQLSNFEVRRLNAQVDKLEQEKAELLSYVDRLAATRRVAQIDVLAERVNEHGRPLSVLQWQEIGADGMLGPPKTLEVLGRQVFFEGLVLKFAPRHVAEGDAMRGSSLVLFRRAFGDAQAPESGVPLDSSSRPPQMETKADAETAAYHERLWSRFWDFVEDPKLAEQYGVRVAQCEAPSIPVRPGQIWELSLDAAGGLNLRKIGTVTGS